MNVDYIEKILEKGKEKNKQVMVNLADDKILLYFDMEDYHYSWIIYEDNNILIRERTGSRIEEYLIDCDYIISIHLSEVVKDGS